MLPSDDQPKIWAQYEAELREGFEEFREKQKNAFEENLEKLKIAIFSPDTPIAQKNQPQIVPITIVWCATDVMMPLAMHTIDFMGTHEEAARYLDSHMKDLLNSSVYRKNQQLVFNKLKDGYKMSDRNSLDMIIPDAGEDERARVYNRLKQGRRRKKRAMTGTKSKNCSPDRPRKK